MKKNDLVVKQSSQLALKKTQGLLGITSKILAHRNELAATVDENWMYRLWEWADENNINEEMIPREIGALTQLTELKLHDNNLSELPKEIWQLTRLTRLHLHRNRLSELPKEIGQLRHLKELILNHNNLTELPKEIGQLTKLEELCCGGNKFTELPKEIGQLTKLTGITINQNSIDVNIQTPTDKLDN